MSDCDLAPGTSYTRGNEPRNDTWLYQIFCAVNIPGSNSRKHYDRLYSIKRCNFTLMDSNQIVQIPGSDGDRQFSSQSGSDNVYQCRWVGKIVVPAALLHNTTYSD